MEKTNEPVAWISVLGVDLIGQKFTDVRVSLTKTDVASIPLYTHPVSQYKAITNTKIEPTVVSYTHPVKELTDEEITICMGSLPKYNSEIVDEDLVNFARAILRKAQENGNV